MAKTYRKVVGIDIEGDPELAASLHADLDDAGAEVEASYPDLATAISRLAWAAGVLRVLIVRVRSAAGLAPLRQLGEVCGGLPIIALVERTAGLDLFLGANRHGAAQVVPLPLTPGDLAAALERIGAQFGGTPERSEMIAVAGVTGGCGATALAANLAYEVAHLRECSCILAEPSLQIGRLANFFDVEPVHSIQDLFRSMDDLDLPRVESALTRIDSRLRILAGPDRAVSGLAGTSADVRRILHLARKLADVVFLDVPCTLDDHYFDNLAAADRIVLISEQKIPAIRALRVVCDALDALDPIRPRVLVVNRYDPGKKGLSIKRLEDVMKLSQFHTISNDFAAMNATIDHGRPLRLEAPRSRVLADIITLARALFPDIPGVSHTANRRPFFSRLTRCLGLA